MAFAVSEGELTSLSAQSSVLNPASRPWGITGFRGMVSTYEVIYASQPNVRTVVDYQARQAGDLTARLLERTSDTAKERRFDHPLDRLLRHPHPKMSAPKFLRFLVSDLLVFDNIVAVKTQLPGRRAPVALTRIPPQIIEPIGGDFLTAEGFRVGPTGKVFSWDQVVHVAGYNPKDIRWGLSPIETLRRILAEDLASSEARAQFFDRSARLSGWIGRPVDAPEWSTTARDRFDSSWRDRLTADGPEAGSTPVLEEGMVFHQETYDAEALAYIEARKLTGVECSRHYHVHPSLLGFSDTPVDDTARRGLIADNLTPLMGYIAAELALQLLPDFETGIDAFDRFELDFDIEGKLRGDFLAEAEATSRATGAPWLLRNEARARRGLKPVDGGDDLVTPLNVTSGGRASPADTAPGTPGLGQASRRRKNRKAITDLAPTAQVWAEHHATIIATNVERQKARFRSRLGAGSDPTTAFHKERADTELGDDLAGIALEYGPVAASAVAEQFGIEYDVTGDEGWLVATARSSAGNFNAATLAAILEAEGNADTELDDFDEPFDDAGGSRADSFGLGRVAAIAGFAAHSAAEQGGAKTKTWLVTSPNARASHAVLDGTTIGMGEDFDVGGYLAPWPGHIDLPPDEAAGCTCGVEFSG